MKRLFLNLLLTILLVCLVATSQTIAAPLTYTITDLGTLGGTVSKAYGINDSGQVVGYSHITSGMPHHAFLYDGTIMQDLGTLGGTYSYALGINNSGQVVGESKTTGDAAVHTFLYDGGTMYDLSDLFLGSGWTVNNGVQCINDAGQIAGYGLINGQTHAFLATLEFTEPIPEPTTIVLMGCGLLGLLGIAIRHRRKTK